jgi:hypothetical protein
MWPSSVSLQAAADLPSEVARERITEALRQLDDTIHEIRSYAFSAAEEGMPPAAASPNGATSGTSPGAAG